MVYVRSRKFCCCLPVRFGVFVIAILGIIGGGLVSVAGWLQIKQLSQHPLDRRDEVALWTQTVMYTLLAILSFFGLIGVFNKARPLISLYSTMLFSHLGFSIATGAFFLYALFHQTGDNDIQSCINGSTDDLKKQTCQKGFEVIRGVIVGAFVVIWLIELYGCIIVANYVEQLDNEETAKSVVEPAVPVTTYNNFAPNYAFARPDHSYGRQGNSSNV
ncbi:hypothetical protein PILCRDRAFT_825831 [Piloderma croceum F 1598]|uniref:MARVEL domain-containing protein n=1 Tax=Piloderma croceum (strain F 1598) TaxID=765440 RepID=A0A0C3ASE9_PILCF|nr:hypothetical protein PILCRDRAFT_825831 [Piloderma croceum F 1598]